MDEITVITLTRGYNTALLRAVASVLHQDYPGRIVHRIIVDNCLKTYIRLSQLESSENRILKLHLEARTRGELKKDPRDKRTVYPRIARLLNLGVEMSETRWIAFLDDDNQYEPNHLSSLVNCAKQNRCSAVHSGRMLYYRDGSPYLEPRFPWVRARRDQVRIYRLLCERGVWIPGTNILYDRADPRGTGKFRNSTILSNEDPIFLVDTSVWLLDIDLVRTYPVPEKFSEKDFRENTAPDDKFLEQLLDNKVPIRSSGLATVRYYLGGISNSNSRSLGTMSSKNPRVQRKKR